MMQTYRREVFKTSQNQKTEMKLPIVAEVVYRHNLHQLCLDTTDTVLTRNQQHVTVIFPVNRVPFVKYSVVDADDQLVESVNGVQRIRVFLSVYENRTFDEVDWPRQRNPV